MQINSEGWGLKALVWNTAVWISIPQARIAALCKGAVPSLRAKEERSGAFPAYSYFLLSQQHERKANCQSSPSPENWQETNGWQRYFLSTTFQASKARLSVLLNVTLILKGTFFRKELAKYSSLHFLLDNSTISSSLQVFGRSKKNFGGHGELDNCWSVSVLVKHVCQAVIRTQYWSKGGSEGEHTTT